MRLPDVFLAGGPVMWPLLACSVTVLTVVLERGFYWLQVERGRDRHLVDDILELARHGEWEAIRQRTRGCRDYVIRMLVVGILHREFSMARAMEAEAEAILTRMRRRMTVLDTMITVAPLLGILGTVTGIIHSFDMLGSGGIADPRLVSGGIAQALITTATGLAIAIVTVFPYNYFNSRIDHAAYVMEKYGTSLEVVHDKLLRERRHAGP
ncbi:MotA/TolQ/ExbB proton channel family protein [Thermodesulfobacteriota bacterium B35]